SADFDGDGKPDLAVANYSSNSVSILKNNGNGTFESAVNYGVGVSPYSVTSADFDGDGKPDLAGANAGSGSVSILKNNGNGTFASAVNYGVGSVPYSVSSADFDGDGEPDLAVANAGSGSVSILKNNGNGTFASAVNYGVGGSPTSVTSADFDGDGKPDLAVAYISSSNVSILKNNGNGTFASAVNYGVGSGPYSVTSADFDGDGKPDLAVANEYSSTVSILKNDGNGTFASAVNYGVGINPRSVTSADFDGDGKPDLAVANYSNNVSILKNDGNGTFASAVNYGVGSYAISVTSADFDGDGKSDLAVANYFSVTVSILINVSNVVAPTLTSPTSDTATEASLFVYHATSADPDGPSATYSFTNKPSWMASNADSIYGTAVYPVSDTSFSVIVSDGFLADTQVVSLAVLQVTPEVDSLLVDNKAANLNVIDHTPLFVWDYFDPTGVSPQTQIEFAVGTNNNWAFAEMWNPAPFISSDSFLTYAGVSLVDGATYYLRIRVYNGSRWSPWREEVFRMNSVPSTPALVAPVSNTIVGSSPSLIVTNATDAENDALVYDFEIYSDPLITNQVLAQSGVASGSGTTVWNVPSSLPENSTLYWRARSFDAYEYSAWSAVSSFVVDGINEPPSVPSTISPANNPPLPIFTMLPTFSWNRALDPDPNDMTRYKLAVAFTPSLNFATVYDSLTDTLYTITGVGDSLFFGTRFYWKVTAFDSDGLSAASPVQSFWTWELGDVNHSHVTDISDLTAMIDYLFISLAPISPEFVADVDGDCVADIADLTRLIDYLFISLGPLDVGCE
ncbi:MAG: FG-GAP-like repeat-containing protein, partial [candidate division Zixibacteria bacterium]|nr:FG-GAP-like repeat-containing protein [candidate division Zixibacteria bacterium]